MRYPPQGVRGMGGTTRANGFGRQADYVARCQDELCLLLQIEDRHGLDNLEAIAAVEGVDGLFIGPADLAASLGYAGQIEHPAVQAEVENAIRRVKACGRAPGIITANADLARRYMALGSLFTAVGTDIGLLARGSEQLARAFSAGRDAG
jgi:4-hydroxy-2-oxoheptanedioate aldolase